MFDTNETLDSPPPIPAVSVPGYEVHAVLGRGGMGVVYRATQLSLGRAVALKVVLSGVHVSDRERIRFAAEARTLAGLQHPNIVHVIDFGDAAGLPWFALELCPGGTLADRLTTGPLPPAEAASLVATLARAVEAVHRAGLIHRDLKPANILFTRDGIPKVSDFGLARDADGLGTSAGVALGTPAYMAPEQARGEPLDARADVYALGAILCECLTGRRPYEGPNAMAVQMFAAFGQVPIRPVREVNPAVPEWLATVCHRALERDRDRRYATAADLAAALVPPAPAIVTRGPVMLVTPFSAAEARAAQEAWAKHLGLGSHEMVVDLGHQPPRPIVIGWIAKAVADAFLTGELLTLVLVPPGTFLMGVNKPESKQSPRRVMISKPFWVGKSAITQAQYRAVTGGSPSRFAAWSPSHPLAGEDTSRCPAESMSWQAAVSFCREASRRTSMKLALLTEAQREWACRAGTQTRAYWGDEYIADYFWLPNPKKPQSDDNFRTYPVGLKPLNPFGLDGMLGQLYEWCEDCSGAYPPGDLIDPIGPPPGSHRIARGGADITSGISLPQDLLGCTRAGFRVAAPVE